MGEGRAVEGRQANPSVCLATPLLSGSPKAFLTKNSSRVIAFLPGLPRAIFAKGSICINALLPGTALRVENDVTSTKQTTGEFLPGATTAQYRAQISIAKPLSNRELRLLEPTLTHRKQTIAPRSNRELSTNPCFCISDSRRAFTSHSLALFTLTQEGPQEGPVLTETGSNSETAVTLSKETTAPFLTGARTGSVALHFSRAKTHPVAPPLLRFANRRSRRTLRMRNGCFTAATAFRYSAWTMLDLGYVREHLDAIEKMARDRGITLTKKSQA